MDYTLATPLKPWYIFRKDRMIRKEESCGKHDTVCEIEVSVNLSYKQFNKNYTSHFLRIASHFNTLKTPTLLVLARLFWCFHNPSNYDMDCRIFNMCMWPFCRCIQMGDLYLGDLSLQSHLRDFRGICTEFDSGETSGQTQRLACDDHPSIWWPGLIMLNFGFQEWVLLLSATVAP